MRYGAGGDDNFWEDAIQTWFPGATPAQWPHVEGGVTTPYPIVKAGMIPYIINDKSGVRSLDHLLVGFTAPTGNDETQQGTGDWGSADPTSPLGRLGFIIIKQLNPNRANARVASDWVNRATAQQDPMPDMSVDYTPPRPRRWAFRVAEYNVEKSVRVPYAVAIGGGTFARANLLVGYVGGGAI